VIWTEKFGFSENEALWESLLQLFHYKQLEECISIDGYFNFYVPYLCRACGGNLQTEAVLATYLEVNLQLNDSGVLLLAL
jgi:hypothetical protein